MIVREILCKTALSISRLPGLTYALNPYRGCSHNCVYCYAPFVLREIRTWGEFVDVKMSIDDVLFKELKHKNIGTVGISTVTDPYQPVERKYEITRKCLSVLFAKNWHVSIQTKSSLILRDLDVLKGRHVDVGITITTINDDDAKIYEPGSTPVEERVECLRELSSVGIDTWVFIGPVMPCITDKNLSILISKLKNANVKLVLVDKIRVKPGIQENIDRWLTVHHPELLDIYRDDKTMELRYSTIRNEIIKLCKYHGIPVGEAFAHYNPGLK